MTKYSVCSGWRRGGTSAMMLALRQAGIPILGFKFPFVFTVNDEETKKTAKKDGGLLKPFAKATELFNTGGYWELSSVATRTGIQDKYCNAGIEGDLVKIPSDVLPLSNPDMVGKVIVMMRNPRKVITSLLKCGHVKNEREWVRFVSLGLLHNIVGSLKWLEYHKKEYRIVKYDELLENPSAVLKGVCEFLDRGDYTFGVDVIEKKLDKCEPIKYKCAEIKEVEDFYNGNHEFKRYKLKELLERINKMNTHGFRLDKLITANKAGIV